MKSVGPNWGKMNRRERWPVPGVTQIGIPAGPGVYALYRGGAAVYVGKAKSLKARLWKCHLRRGRSMTNSAMRRNVAEFLGIASATDIKEGRYEPTLEDARRVSDRIGGGELAWIDCESEVAAIDLENKLKREWLPPLTKR